MFIWTTTHRVHTQAQSVICNCAFCRYESLPFYLSVSQTAGQWTPVSTHPRNQFPMQTSRYYSILISVLVAESSKLGFYIRQVIVEPESSAYPPQSCPFGGCVHVPITAPSTPGTGLLGTTPTYPTSYRNPMVLHCPCVTVYILISIASFLTYLIVISTELCILLHRSEKSPKYLLFTITLFCY